MSTQPFSPVAVYTRSTLRVICASGAALVGLVLLSYAVYFVPNQLAGSASPGDSSALGLALLFLAMVGLLSIAGAIGYWLNKTWGWYIQLVSVLGQFLFPGMLFEFKIDMYHMVGWFSPVISLVILILMGIEIRRKKRAS